MTRLRALWDAHGDKPLALAALLLLAVVLAWQLGRLVWLLLSGPAQPLPVPVVQAPVAAASSSPAQVASLFGENSGPQQATVADTTLQLRLDGVMESSDPASSRAMIAERGNGLVKTFKPGDQLPGGASLARVEATQVVLDRNGREEILRFDKLADKPVSPPPGQPGRAADTVNALDKAVSNFASSPMAALRQMGLRRTSQGYVVSITAQKDMLKRYGLQPGDRIVSINGQSVGKDLEADQQTLGQLQSAGSARVEVQRGTQTITLEQRL